MENEKLLIDVNAMRYQLKRHIAAAINWEVNNIPIGKDNNSVIEFLRGYEHGALETAKIALGMPTVDAVEVVHAEWLDGSGMSRDGSVVYQSIDCSHCEEVFKIESETREYWKARFKVCPFCGAKMEDDSNV